MLNSIKSYLNIINLINKHVFDIINKNKQIKYIKKSGVDDDSTTPHNRKIFNPSLGFRVYFDDYYSRYIIIKRMLYS